MGLQIGNNLRKYNRIYNLEGHFVILRSRNRIDIQIFSDALKE